MNLQPNTNSAPPPHTIRCGLVSQSSEGASNHGPPKAFLCPLTWEVMKVPLLTRWGHNFERSALLKWLEQHHSCPLTRHTMDLDDVVVDRSLQKRIQFWQRLASTSPHRYPEDEESSERILIADLQSKTQLSKIIKRSMMIQGQNNREHRHQAPSSKDSNGRKSGEKRVRRAPAA